MNGNVEKDIGSGSRMCPIVCECRNMVEGIA